MEVSPLAPSSAAGDLEQHLLATKFSVPQPRSGAVSRADLIERARSSGSRVVGVTAPAGYGKSTLLAEWARLEDRGVAWVSLDRFDDDPAVLLELLAGAYGRFDPACGSVVAEMGGVGTSLLGRTAPRVAAAFASSPVPFVVFVDDLHELHSPDCHDVLGVVVARIPAGSQLVVASRSEQPHLPRLRASGDALEFVAGDMALDAASAQQIFADMDVSLSAELAAAVTERTEGWPVGLYLAALLARQGESEALAVTGDDRYVADYLYRESLMQQPEEVQTFLRRTATLEQMCAPLCDAVVGSSDAAAQLRRLEAHSLFVVALDRRREWYRYHALFREFLLGELGRTEPEMIAKLHLRAADWYEAQRTPERALGHLLDTPERARTAQLAAELILPTYNAGRISTVQRWLDVLGDQAISEYPPLAVLAGWAGVLTGDVAGAQRWAAFVEAASFDPVPSDGTASFASAQAMLRAVLCAAGPDSMHADAAFAVAEETPGSPWRDTALWELAEANLLLGRLDEARARFTESSTYASTMGNTDSVVSCESELALLAMERNDWDEAAEHVSLALATIDDKRMHDYVLSLLAFAAAARLALHDRDIDRAHNELARAMRARPSATLSLPFVAVRLRVELAKVYLAISETKTARQLLREIDDILIHRPALGDLVDEVDGLRARAATAAVDASSASPLTPAELRVLPYLQTHLSFREIGGRLYVSRHTVKSQAIAIYRKLGVSSRDDAVQRATAIGLLGG